MLLVENGTIIDPASGREGQFDILVEGETIRGIEKPGGFGRLEGEVTRVDAKGCWITPGFIDLHVHLREPGQEWKETILTGSEAAVMGGFTTICAMPNTEPAIDCAEVAKYVYDKARSAGLARVYPIGAVSLARAGKNLAPLSELKKAGCVAFSDDGDPVYDSGLMRRALEWSGMLGLTIACHEEDKCLSAGGHMNESCRSMRMGLRGWPKVAEEVMIARDIELARTTKSPTHFCHVSTARGAELIRRAKADGIPVTAEVTPHHLVLTEAAVEGYDTFAKLSPPLREEEDVAALRAALADGTLDAIASDHAPHEIDGKRVEFGRASWGIIGLQTSFPLVMELVANGTISRSRGIEALTKGPARCFGLSGGTLAPGAAADIVVFNPEERWTFTEESIRSLSFNSPFLGRELTGVVKNVIVGGRLVVAGGRLVDR